MRLTFAVKEMGSGSSLWLVFAMFVLSARRDSVLPFDARLWDQILWRSSRGVFVGVGGLGKHLQEGKGEGGSNEFCDGPGDEACNQ